MEILQLPLHELQERIEQELVENPALELQERDPTLPDEPDERDDPPRKERSKRSRSSSMKPTTTPTISNGC